MRRYHAVAIGAAVTAIISGAIGTAARAADSGGPTERHPTGVVASAPPVSTLLSSLNSKLTTSDSPIYAGVAQNSPTSVSVFATDPANSQLAADIGIVTRASGSRVRIKMVSAAHSLAALAALRDTITAQTADLAAHGVILSYYGTDVGANKVDVGLPTNDPKVIAELDRRYGANMLSIEIGRTYRPARQYLRYHD